MLLRLPNILIYILHQERGELVEGVKSYQTAEGLNIWMKFGFLEKEKVTHTQTIFHK